MTLAVVLCAGRGTRLWPVTEATDKVMVRILGRPLLEYLLDGIYGLFRKIVLVTGGNNESVRGHFARSDYAGKLCYATQSKQKGTAHAVLAARKELGEENFVVFNGDTFFSPNFFKTLGGELKKDTPFVVGKRIDDAAAYGLLEVENGRLCGVLEKPAGRKSGVINTGAYFAKNDFLEFLSRVRLSKRGELEATQALAAYAKDREVRVLEHTGYWNDVGYYWNYLDTSSFVLENVMECKILGAVEENVAVKGKLFVGKNSVVKSGTYIEGPVYIGEECDVGPGAYLRPCTVLEGRNHVGNSSEIKNSMLLKGADAPHLNYVADSIICEDVNLGAGTITANLRFDDADVKPEINGMRVSSGKRKLGVVVGAGTKIGVNASINCGTLIGSGARIYPHALVKRNVASKEHFKGE